MMYKSPSRNQRSKGIKVKHVLQICLLVAVCFWLIYQVKHSHDKKKEFAEHDAKISLNTDGKFEVAKLGRKDLHPRVEGTTIKDLKHDEELEEENTGEEEEQEENKTEEKDDDEGRGNVDEELDDHDQEKSDAENDHEEDFVDDEKERDINDEQENEEKDSEEKTAKVENYSGSQDHEHEGAARNTHEAREENYKADDASSAVTHDTQITASDNETMILEKSNDQTGMMTLEHDDTSNDTKEINGSQNSLLKAEDGETAKNDSYVAPTTNGKNVSTDSIETGKSSDQVEASGNSTELGRATGDLSLGNGNDTTHVLTRDQSTVDVAESGKEGFILQDTVSKSEDNSTLDNENNQHDSTIFVKSEATDSDQGELIKLSENAESSISENKSNDAAETEDNSGTSLLENTEATWDVKDEGLDGANEGSDEANSEISDEVPHDPIDSSDSSFSLEEKDVRTDLETLPEIQTEGSSSEDAVAE